MENELPLFKIQEIVHIKRENTTLKTNCKDTYVLSCRLYGESTFFYKGQSKTVKRGDVLYIPQGASYCQTCREEEIVAVHLEVRGNMPNEIRVITPENPEEMCRFFGNLAKLWKEKSPDAFYGCMAQLYQILSVTHMTEGAAPAEDYGVITPAVAYLQAHMFDEDLAMEKVYRQAPVSQTSFIKHFRSYFGGTPVKYVNRQRIAKAQMLLKSHQYTREEVANLCGFENVKHFYVVFKTVTGCTTGEYLKRQ